MRDLQPREGPAARLGAPWKCLAQPSPVNHSRAPGSGGQWLVSLRRLLAARNTDAPKTLGCSLAWHF